MNINETVFFNEVRASVFGGSMKQSQVEGCQTLLNIWHDEFSEHPIEYLSYCLATVIIEVGLNMQPVREGFKGTDEESIAHVQRLLRIGKIRRDYSIPNKETGKSYFGRGFVQITWDYNYKKLGDRLGVNLYEKPEKALETDIAAQALFVGCIEGLYTGKKLSDYITENKCNYRQARRIVNGMDRASKLSRYAKKFEFALKEAMSLEVTPRKLENAGSRTVQATKANRDAGWVIVGTGILGAAGKVLETLKSFTDNLGAFADSFIAMASNLYIAIPIIGGLVVWYSFRIDRARIEDEAKIGRLSHD